MCSRLDAERDVVMRHFDIDAGSAAVLDAKWGEIFPTDPTLLLGPKREPLVRRWGLTPDWAERPIINAKAEDAATKRTFQPLLQHRCIVPVTGYYEWRVENGRKVKTRIGANGVLPMAGLFTSDAYVLFTCAPAPSIAHIHNRMPVVLPDDVLDGWLDPNIDFAEVRPVMQPYVRMLTFSDAEQPRPAERTRPLPRQGSLF